MAKKPTAQEQFDALIAEYGAVAVIAAIKNHVHPDSGGTCPQTPCPTGYYCSAGQCILDVGK